MLAYYNTHVMEPSEGCRDWPFTTNRGYGIIYKGTRTAYRVHTMTCKRWHGPAPSPGLEVAHSCGRAVCWAGEHLRWATHIENMHDMILHGHTNRGKNNKLTVDQVKEIRQRYAIGNETHRSLGEEYGVSHRVIGGILTGERWAWLD
jgi:hypothetical protein